MRLPWTRRRWEREGAEPPRAPRSLRQRRAAAVAAVRRRGAVAAFAVGLAAITIVVVVVLSQDGLRRAGYNFTPVQGEIGMLAPGASGCQPEPFSVGTRGVVIHAAPLAAGRVAIRIRIAGAGRADGTGPPGALAAGGIAAALPHGPPPLVGVPYTMCVINTGAVTLALIGAPTGADQMVIHAAGAAPLVTLGRIRVDDLLSARPLPLWRSLPRLPDRIAAATGSLLAPWLVGGGAILALIAAFGLMRGPRRIRFDLAWLLALAFASGALWAGLTPAWSKTDEVAHFAYVQAVATQGHPPAVGDLSTVSGQLSCWEAALGIQRYRFFAAERPPWFLTPNAGYAQSCQKQSPVFDGASYTSDQPPAYYYMAAVPYLLASSATLPTKLLAVRLFSVLLAAIAVLFTYLLVVEVIPGSRWPARAGAAALALQPIFMFNTSGVNSDALVVAVAAAIAYLCARAWRRGFGLRYALMLGALTGLGIVSKLNFLTLLPSIALLGIALWLGRYARRSWRERVLGAARLSLGALVAVAIYELYVILDNDVWHRGGAASRGATIATSTTGLNLRRLGDFVWQFFLPRLPGRPRLFPYYPLWNDILKGITTRLGWWNVFGFDGWAPVLVLLACVIAAAAAVYILPRARRRPWPPLIAFAALALFLLALVVADFRVLGAGGDGFEGRYVFPALPLWGLLVGCAVAAVPPRWRAPATGILVALFVGHTVLAISSATSTYYL